MNLQGQTVNGNLAEVDDLGDRSDHHHAPPEPLGLAPDPVEVRRNGGLAALVGGLASTVAIAYLARAAGTGAPLDWLLAAVMALLGLGHLAAFVDARTPLLVADGQGVRLRVGQTWRGLPWGALRAVEVQQRRGLLRDGRLVLVLRNPERLIEELDRRGRRQSRLSRRLYGAPFAVPLALSTRVSGAGDDLAAALARLAGDAVPVVDLATVPEVGVEEIEVEDDRVDHDDLPTRRRPDPRPGLAHLITVVSSRLQRDTVDADPAEGVELEVALDEEAGEEDAQLTASATPSPLRDPVGAARAEVHRQLPEDDDPEDGRELRRVGSVSLVEDTQVWGERVRPIAKAGHPVEALRIDDFTVEPADDPVVGPSLSAARTRLGLTVDQLAERTRIRPHVIESIEVDDFAPCGGDFYARGHLRTLARVLGVDVAPLLTAYDERYADAPINARRVFEAELATGAGGSIRSTRGGPNWSVLIAAVMTLVLAWSIARLVMDSPVDLRTTPVLNGSGGVAGTSGTAAPAVPVRLTAAGGGAHVVVRDAGGTVVFNGDLAFGQSRTVEVSPPVRVQSSDGSVEVVVDGEGRGPLGATGEPAQNTFVVE